jgi:uncharacterized Fe-S cluster-containing radical SAM superfamily protein
MMITDGNKYIDTEKFSSKLREKGIDINERKILITTFKNSEQGHDLTLPPNCSGFGRIHHFKRDTNYPFPSNPLPIDPACNALGLPETDEMQVQVFQNAICSWRCWYCFVDFSLLSANPHHSEFKSVSELLDLFEAEALRPPIIDLSGGQPDLVPEWSLWFADEIQKRGLQRRIYLWSDDNLSNDYLWRFLSHAEIRRLASYKNYGRVGCFKGFDEESFSFNTLAEPSLFNNQFKLMRKLVDAEFDVYGYCTFTATSDALIRNKMKAFIDRLQTEVHEYFPLRTVPLEIITYTPTKKRMSEDHDRSIQIQKLAIEAWNEEINYRFSAEMRAKKIYEHKLS